MYHRIGDPCVWLLETVMQANTTMARQQGIMQCHTFVVVLVQQQNTKDR